MFEKSSAPVNGFIWRVSSNYFGCIEQNYLSLRTLSPTFPFCLRIFFYVVLHHQVPAYRKEMMQCSVEEAIANNNSS